MLNFWYLSAFWGLVFNFCTSSADFLVIESILPRWWHGCRGAKWGDIIITFESFQSFGEEEFDIGKERVSSDTEVFANNVAFDILSDEKNAVQFFDDARTGTHA